VPAICGSDVSAAARLLIKAKLALAGDPIDWLTDIGRGNQRKRASGLMSPLTRD